MRSDAHFLVEGAHRRGVVYNDNEAKSKGMHTEIPGQGEEKRLHVNIKKNLPGKMRPDPALVLGIDFPAPGTRLIPINLPGDLDSWLNLATICLAHFARGSGWWSSCLASQPSYGAQLPTPHGLGRSWPLLLPAIPIEWVAEGWQEGSHGCNGKFHLISH